MKLSPYSPLPWVAKTVRYLSLVLLPALASEARVATPAAQATHPRATAIARTRPSVPYLALVGSPGLMLAETPAALPDAPPPPEPPKPSPTPEPPKVEPPPPEPPRPVETPVEVIPTPEPTPTPPPAPVIIRTGPRPVSILPDDTVIELSPEEVLPYFRYPGGVPEPYSAPTPQQLPPSSATYQQR